MVYLSELHDVNRIFGHTVMSAPHTAPPPFSRRHDEYKYQRLTLARSLCIFHPIYFTNMSDQKDPVLEKIENTKAVYRRLGKSGLRVSVPILGAMSFGDPAWQPWILDEEASLPLLKAAYDKGINTWDSANIYSNGVSETIIGKAIKKYQIPREKVVVLSKCFAYIGEEPGIKTMTYGQKIAESPDYVNQGGLSRTAIFNAVNKSLKRLDLEYLDLLQIHRFDPNTPIEETMEALHDLVRSGKVRYIGASSMWTYQFCS
jgi:aryl-alcohol dehydrogenase-like predicted oxidoreductase